jgi:hypothetical protein
VVQNGFLGGGYHAQVVLGNKLIHKEVKRRCAFRASEKTINHSGSWLLFSHLLLIHLSLCKKILKRFYSPQRVSAHRGNEERHVLFVLSSLWSVKRLGVLCGSKWFVGGGYHAQVGFRQ